MAGIVDEILEHKEEIIVKIINVLEGKQASADLNLDGIKFILGKNMQVKLSGTINLTIAPTKTKKKK
ncbi:MAG: hypothetical protein ABIF08_02720 [Nanoarchaeota archaeon]